MSPIILGASRKLKYYYSRDSVAKGLDIIVYFSVILTDHHGGLYANQTYDHTKFQRDKTS